MRNARFLARTDFFRVGLKRDPGLYESVHLTRYLQGNIEPGKPCTIWANASIRQRPQSNEVRQRPQSIQQHYEVTSIDGSNIEAELEGKGVRLSDGGAQAGAEASMGLARHQTPVQSRRFTSHVPVGAGACVRLLVVKGWCSPLVSINPCQLVEYASHAASDGPACVKLTIH